MSVQMLQRPLVNLLNVYGSINYVEEGYIFEIQHSICIHN
jgi:hypothetical protein